MRTGRSTTDKKTDTVKLRISDEMRSYLELKSNKRNISISEYVRQLIKLDMRK